MYVDRQADRVVPPQGGGARAVHPPALDLLLRFPVRKQRRYHTVVCPAPCLCDAGKECLRLLPGDPAVDLVGEMPGHCLCERAAKYYFIMHALDSAPGRPYAK